MGLFSAATPTTTACSTGNSTTTTNIIGSNGTSDATKGQVPDVYGQVHPIETKELIQLKMIEFDNEINRLLQNKNDTTIKNLQLAHSQYNTSTFITYDFKLKFLQCEVYNVSLAIKRYINYWNKRVTILGYDNAFNDFTYNNLSSDTISALQSGVIHIIERTNTGTSNTSTTTSTNPGTGSSTSTTGTSTSTGNERNIIYIQYGNFTNSINRQSFVIGLWYLLHVIALENDESSKHGAIIIANASTFKFSQCDKQLIELIISSIKECLPVRLSAYHLYKPPYFINFFIPIVFLFIAKRLKQRLLIHSGNNTNSSNNSNSNSNSTELILNELDTKYGFKRQHLPTDMGGSYQLNINQWLQNRQSSNEIRLRIPTMTNRSLLPDTITTASSTPSTTSTSTSLLQVPSPSPSPVPITTTHVSIPFTLPTTTNQKDLPNNNNNNNTKNRALTSSCASTILTTASDDEDDKHDDDNNNNDSYEVIANDYSNDSNGNQHVISIRTITTGSFTGNVETQYKDKTKTNYTMMTKIQTSKRAMYEV